MILRAMATAIADPGVNVPLLPVPADRETQVKLAYHASELMRRLEFDRMLLVSSQGRVYVRSENFGYYVE